MARVLLLPSAVDCDPTELAVPWSVLAKGGHALTIATPGGARPIADPRMLTGEGLALWSGVLKARKDARVAWSELVDSPTYRQTVAVEDTRAEDFAAVIFTGGHAPGMRTYLESKAVQARAIEAFERDLVVGAICHGVVVLARARRSDGKSVLYGRRTTALLRAQELLAWNLTRAWLGDYYRTYPTPVEDEVTAALEAPAHFLHGPTALLRDAPGHLGRGFVVEDARYVSSRWPGDAYRFSDAVLRRLA